jgi:hypothetical protein
MGFATIFFVQGGRSVPKKSTLFDGLISCKASATAIPGKKMTACRPPPAITMLIIQIIQL